MATHTMFPFIKINILNDLSSRFIYNIPVEERLDIIKLCTHVEKAHWYYLDNYKQKIGFKKFTLLLFQHVPFLSNHVNNVYEIVDEFNS